MEGLMLALIFWVSMATNYVFVEEMEYPMIAIAVFNLPGRTEAAYIPEVNMILLGPEFSLENPIQLAYLTHEIVHYLQHQNVGLPSNPTCVERARFEREAYRIQAKWHKEFDVPEAPVAFIVEMLLVCPRGE